MSTLTTATPMPAHTVRKMTIRALTGLVLLVLLLGGGVFVYRRTFVGTTSDIPTVKVVRGDISLSVFSRGEVRGGNSQQLSAPMTGGTELHILYLGPNGAQVKTGDVVVRFDPTDQEYALKEAEADVAESRAHIEQAQSQLEADKEDDRYNLEKGRSDLALAELEARKNPILPSITARQNDLAVAVARDKLAQLQKDASNRLATNEAGVRIQQAAQGKADAKILTARQNIEAMTLKANRDGYLALKSNTNVNIMYSGMELPSFQLGDSVRPGMMVAEIPDLSHWEVNANLGELDRGHLNPGDPAQVNVVALPGRALRAHVIDVGSTEGSPWDRHFQCKLALDESAPGLRPGMSARVEITTETIPNALWLPAQALFTSDGKTFVYVRSGNSFARKDVTLLRRNDTRVVISGLSEGREVALVNPAEAAAKKSDKAKGPLDSLPQ